ncbi:peroxiredoxin Q/BCP [Roseimicrobium gellanilyticum]|uniref:thioredoxin-dependent peroxiredoxin n=1 Tax=Roseimicrobium gellanilyticum TaxID=748857 RepID=A0A366HU91_9BACT|nr:peroxiredoxin Q/BCP [Roseimicrobium gellanilyticum]
MEPGTKSNRERRSYPFQPIVKLFILIAAMSLFGSFFASASEGKLVEPYEAPKVEAQDQNGKTVKLEEEYAKGLTLVYFYPKSGTPGCTAQACSLRDAYEDLTKEGIKVFGVSTDDVEAQKKFVENKKLPFTILADPDGKVLEAFKVKKIPLIGLASRQAFLIKDGKVIWHDAKASTSEQAADVLKVVRELRK